MKSYSRAVSPCVGGRQPQKNMPLDPLYIKVGLGKPKKNRRKDSHENPKKSGKLTRHGRVMSCKTYGQISHNKRSCLNEANVSTQPIPQKRRRGRLRKFPMEPQPENMPTRGKGTTSVKGRSKRGGRARSRGGYRTSAHSSATA